MMLGGGSVAFEAGRDGFWLARWLQARGIEAYVIHPTSVAVSREQRRAKTDRLDIGLLKRSFLGWLLEETLYHELVVATVLSSPKIFADDTALPVLDPGRGKTPAIFGATPLTTGPGAVPPIPRWLISIPRTARTRALPNTWRTPRAYCR
jgi:hypothetical protein